MGEAPGRPQGLPRKAERAAPPCLELLEILQGGRSSSQSKIFPVGRVDPEAVFRHFKLCYRLFKALNGRFGSLGPGKAVVKLDFGPFGGARDFRAKFLGLGSLPLTLKGSTALTAQGWFSLHRRSSSPSLTWAARACGQVAR